MSLFLQSKWSWSFASDIVHCQPSTDNHEALVQERYVFLNKKQIEINDKNMSVAVRYDGALVSVISSIGLLLSLFIFKHRRNFLSRVKEVLLSRKMKDGNNSTIRMEEEWKIILECII